MDVFKYFKRKGLSVTSEPMVKSVFGTVNNPSKLEADGIFKAYIPEFLYRPPYGYPRKVNTVTLKQLSKNPFIFSIIKTLYDEIIALDWKVQFKKNWPEDTQIYEAQRVQAERFFKNPNGNEESFEEIIKGTITALCEVDSAVWVKVFTSEGRFKQLFIRDGSLFLKNPDIYGYMGGRAEFVAPVTDKFMGINYNNQSQVSKEMIQKYDVLFRDQAAYFQYGWTAGSMPIPFGRREIVYLMLNPRYDSIYGQSPVEVLSEVLYNLIYGVEYNLDFYTNNNMPDGVIELLGAEQDHIDTFREGMQKKFMFIDTLGKQRKRFFNIPITNSPVKFTPFMLSSKEMQILEQQKWFIKLVWACFGVTGDEMGFTEDSNKAVSQTQSKVHVRKGIKPLLKVLEYNINTQILPEFFVGMIKADGESVSLPDFCDVPIEFKFDIYDIDEDKERHDLLEQELRMGVKTPEMVAEELGINVDLLKESKESLLREQEQRAFVEEEERPNTIVEQEGIDNVVIKKSEAEQVIQDVREPLEKLDSYINEIMEGIIHAVELIPENELYKDVKE